MNISLNIWRLAAIGSLVILFLSGCAMPEYGDAGGLAAGNNEGGGYADAVAQFAVNSPPGSTGDVVLRDNRHVRVRVGGDYMSASAEQCRRVILETGIGDIVVSAVCRGNNVWRTIVWP